MEEASSGFALMFVSGQFRGGELPLMEGVEVLAGRDESVTLRLVEEGVSRIHAKFVARDGTVELRDMGSTNGTYVNGERVRTAQLRVGSRVLIGRSILTLIRDPGWAD